jgi:hypothetical protein
LYLTQYWLVFSVPAASDQEAPWLFAASRT